MIRGTVCIWHIMSSCLRNSKIDFLQSFNHRGFADSVVSVNLNQNTLSNIDLILYKICYVGVFALYQAID